MFLFIDSNLLILLYSYSYRTRSIHKSYQIEVHSYCIRIYFRVYGVGGNVFGACHFPILVEEADSALPYALD